jgi:hypothetical protein
MPSALPQGSAPREGSSQSLGDAWWIKSHHRLYGTAAVPVGSIALDPIAVPADSKQS